MAVPSAIFFAVCLVVIAVATLLLQRRYLPLRSTPEYLIVATFLGLFLSSSIVVLVPIDLASSSSTSDGSRGVVLPQRVLLIAWRISYWLCFVLTWAILPILLSYSDSGHRSPRKRLLQALRENARYHLTVLSVGAVGLVYFFLSTGFHFYSLKGLLVALSYCYSLFLAISLMGYGLVAIPRGLLQDSSASGKLRRLQRKAPKAYDRYLEASNNLEDVHAEVVLVRQRRTGTALEFQEWIEELCEMAHLPESGARPSGNSRSHPTVPNVITEEYLAGLTRRLKLCIHRRARFLGEWEGLVQSAADAQSIIDSNSSKKLSFTKHFSSPTILEKIPFLNPYTRHIFYSRILPHLQIALAGLLSIASIMIVWTEIVHTTFPKLAVIRYTVVHHPSSAGKIGFAGQIISAAWIAYMCMAAYYSMSAVKVWGSHALVRRMTSASSACFYSSYAARLTVPLAYNFVSFLPQEGVVRKSVFYNFLGKLINLTAISEGFTSFFPMLVLVPVCATLFNLSGRVKSTFGFGDVVVDGGDEEDDGAFATGGWREGRDLIDRELLGVSSGALVSRTRRDGGVSSYRSSSSSGGFAAGRRSPLPGSSSAPRLATRSGRYRDEPTEDERRRERERGEGEEEEGAFSGFMHRVRNTFDTVEPPKWWKDATSQGRPRWMGGDQ